MARYDASLRRSDVREGPADTPKGDFPAVDHATAAAILSNTGIAAYVWDMESDTLAWTGDAPFLFGVRDAAEIATGRRFAQIVDPAGPPGRFDAISGDQRVDHGPGVPYELAYRLVSGTRSGRWLEDCGRWFAGADGRPARAEGVVRLATERQAREQRLVYRGDHDDLTGGLNRTRFVEELAALITTADRDRASCALAIVAVDNLGPLNEAYGFDVGDELISGVSARIEAAMRAGDFLGRLSGNKIGVGLNGCTEVDLRIAAERFSAAVAEAPFSTASGEVALTVSVGGVILPRYARVVGEALARAQEALGAARARGAADIAIYEPSPGREAARRHNIAMAGEVISALNAGRVELALQPIVNARTHQPLFYEGLCRLRVEDGSPVYAGDFIETAERLGIIRLVDHRTLDLAVAALADDRDLNLSINVSSSSALDGGWFSRLAAHIRRDRSLSARLIVEITETMAIADLDRATDFVRSLRDLGCRVAIDDFGAGHTSFRNLRALGADLVKIDGSFVENVADSPDDLFFVSTLVRLAQHMGLETVAERVSSSRDFNVLRAAGVDYLQGHLFGEAITRPAAIATPETGALR